MILAVILLLLCIALIVLYGTTLIRTQSVPYVMAHPRVGQFLKEKLDAEPPCVFVELGCGDASILHTVTEGEGFHTCRGYEIDLYAYHEARKRSERDNKRYEIIRKNFMKEDLSNADVVYTYLLPHVLSPLWKKLSAEVKPGTRLYSNCFPIPGIEAYSVHILTTQHGHVTIYEYRV